MNNQPLPAGLHVFLPPYVDSTPIDLNWWPDPFIPGGSVVWFVRGVGAVWSELEWLSAVRSPSIPLFVVLPEPGDIGPLTPILRAIPDLRPKGVLPRAFRSSMTALRVLLAAPPQSLPHAVADHLEDVGIITDVSTRERVTTIFTSAPHTRSIDRLSRALAQSRRSLGRHFSERGLPVPSHWLQFARLLHVAVQLQNTRTSIHRVSGRFGYTDGFTLSNAMKRLTGFRPSFIRQHLGWEWIVAAWLKQEGWERLLSS